MCGLLVSIYGYFANYVDATIYGLFLANCVASFIEVILLQPHMVQKDFLVSGDLGMRKKCLPV